MVSWRIALAMAGRALADEWITGTYTTGYWDCCKPSCAWSGKGDVDAPVRSCEAETGNVLSDPDVASVCDGGTSASCVDNQPFTINDELTMGFAAAAVGGSSGLSGDENCGMCYELVWTDEEFDYGGGAHPDIVGKRHVVQVTNIGFDVTGSHSFDLQIPSAGQGLFDTGCEIQFPDYKSKHFDCGNNYGGCDDISGCEDLPDDLRAGCEWRFDGSVYGWKTENGKSDNPYVRFRRVKCPSELVAITGTTPNDDDDYPEIEYVTFTPAPTLGYNPSPQPTTNGVCCFYIEGGDACEDCSPENGIRGGFCMESEENCLFCSATATYCAPTDLDDCPDEAEWYKEGDQTKNCSWVSVLSTKRCSVKGADGRFAYEGCRGSCQTCDKGCEGDDADFYVGDPSKDCDWVGRASTVRCKKEGSSGFAYSRCKYACGLCNYENCDDDEDWQMPGEPSKDCDWVGDFRQNRCVKVGDDGSFAFESCRHSCHSCTRIITKACSDSTSWYKRDEPEKGCDWVGGFAPSRCAVRGEDDRWAFEACPVSCSTCS
ncbi:hypothetical protein CTAYLR_008856 [Chrysophaeum taylorii]|uniref:cellulase n=1 Tax=Chrysophaeum taylorii TaxID=2483200 RepID=A0AAD7UNQ3_9STRA|nr:hypothetical protein CTAYLR_008856 [Chrysophaeum taylorii]